MSRKFAGFAILLSGLSSLMLLVAIGRVHAQEADKLNKIADAIQKGDVVGAKKLAVAYARAHKENDELMAAFAKNGLKVGGKKGIEAELRDLAKNGISAADLKARKAELTRMTEHVTAVGYVSETLGIPMEVKKGQPYVKLSLDLVGAAQGLNKAISDQDPAGVQKSAKLVEQSCVVCHSIYRQ